MLSAEEILHRTNNGYDIYKFYLGKVERLCNRPWGRKEKKKSWGIFPGTSWFWKDHASEETGNAITFIQRMFSLNLKEAKEKICADMGFTTTKVKRSPLVTWDDPIEEEKEYIPINFSSTVFKKQHHLFWNCVEVDEKHCEKFQCWGVKDLAINKKKVNIGENEAVFAFYCPEEDGVKIYFPEREKDRRFRNNVSYRHLWNFQSLQKCESLIVQKSVKDMIVTGMIVDCVTSTQAEAVKIFNKEVVEKINSISTNPWIWYGSDWDGVQKCKSITDTNGWKYINTPKNLLPNINDTYGYVKKFGLKQLEEFMKSKKLI